MSSFDVEDTIAAIASPKGSGMRGIVRISGPQMTDCIERLFAAENDQAISTHQKNVAIAGHFQLPSGSRLPGELLLWPTSRSFTRQPTAEFHTIGSPPLLQMVVNAICDHGARLAQPGEFTLRAFLSGRIDLTQAEAVLAVIDADGEQQLTTALRQLAGGLAGPLGDIRQHLLSLLAELEAGLDFVEEDIEFISESELSSQLVVAKQQLARIMKQIMSRDLISEAAKVVLTGMPNSGKSSLFNALTGSGAAIVTEIAGTTTDFISSHLTIESVSVQLIDTAGFESALSPNLIQVMDQAQSHREGQLAQAQVRLLCIDSSREMTEWEIRQLAEAPHSTILVLTKSDLEKSGETAGLVDKPGRNGLAEYAFSHFEGPVVVTSVFDETSLDRLRTEISRVLVGSQHPDQPVVGTTVQRATESLREAQQAVQRALEATRSRLGEEIVAAEIRQSLEGLGQVVGTVYTDDILDLVFSRFCIGK